VAEGAGELPKHNFKEKERKYLEVIKEKSTRVEQLLREVESMHDQNNALVSRLGDIEAQSTLKESKLQAIESQFSQLESEKHALNLERANVFKEKEKLLAQMAEQESRVLDPDDNRGFLGVPSTGRDTNSRQKSSRLENHSREESREKAMQAGWRNDFGKKVKNAFSYYHK
jgi:chromosome segregation ATPase